MIVLKWIGCIAAAILVLSVITGLGMLAVVGGALICIFGLVVLLATFLKGLWEERR